MVWAESSQHSKVCRCGGAIRCRGHLGRGWMTRLHLDNVAELIVRNFQNLGWRKHGGKTCGLTARDYGYRKGWVRERLKQLAGAMAIDVLDDAILGNHLHLVVRASGVPANCPAGESGRQG